MPLHRPNPLNRMAFAAFWIALAGGAVLLGSGLSDARPDAPLTPATWPAMIAAGLVIAAAGQLIWGREDRAPREDAPPPGRILAAVLVTVAYVQGMVWFGFYLITPAFILAYLVVFGERRLLRAALFALIVSLLFYTVFTSLLFISLPTGTVAGLHSVNIAIQDFLVRGGGL